MPAERLRAVPHATRCWDCERRTIPRAAAAPCRAVRPS
jgi:RNA polymerase-binding transcription factor DksA